MAGIRQMRYGSFSGIYVPFPCIYFFSRSNSPRSGRVPQIGKNLFFGYIFAHCNKRDHDPDPISFFQPAPDCGLFRKVPVIQDRTFRLGGRSLSIRVGCRILCLVNRTLSRARNSQGLHAVASRHELCNGESICCKFTLDDILHFIDISGIVLFAEEGKVRELKKCLRWRAALLSSSGYRDRVTPFFSQKPARGHSLHFGDSGVQILLPNVTNSALYIIQYC